MPDDAEIAKLRREAIEFFGRTWRETMLDDEVIASKESEASEINNGGVESQVDYLIEAGLSATLVSLMKGEEP